MEREKAGRAKRAEAHARSADDRSADAEAFTACEAARTARSPAAGELTNGADVAYVL